MTAGDDESKHEICLLANVEVFEVYESARETKVVWQEAQQNGNNISRVQ